MNIRTRALIDLGFRFERDILDYGEAETPVPVWTEPVFPEPSPAEIDAKVAELENAANERKIDSLHRDALLAFAKVLFTHENRIRALEGKAAITAEQFRAALKAQLSS